MRPKSATRIRTGCARDTQTARIARHGATLRLSAKTQQGGSIRIELQDENWNPHEAFSLDQSTPIHGDHLDAPVTWGATTKIPATRPLVLRFQLDRATLYGFELIP
ncbi:MAG: hypothetical protein OXO54_07720 [Chloroflexota bacterium]|nr:hypothetical protein [Chloroflexota bacterium]MDE2898196.1 hypothetical protein [Chloroflexota bacterium]